MADFNESTITPAGKPLQVLPWKDKIAHNGKWFEQSAEWFISQSIFKSGFYATGSGMRDLSTLYNVYNSKFPEKWFAHHTDPLSAENPQHKKFPAKIRPINILRTNLDLLMAEYPRRPFTYQVTNLSDDAYSTYQEELNKAIEGNLTQHFQTMLAQQFMQQGLLNEDGQPVSEDAQKQVEEAMNNLQLPEQVKEQFHASYKDKQAIRGQKWLKRAMKENYIRNKWGKGFKHWLITGEVRSYKTVEFGHLVYEIISSLNLDGDKSPDIEYYEDGEWAVCLRTLTLSDVVDTYYEDLKVADVERLDTSNYLISPLAFHDYLGTHYPTRKVNVLHCVWKGKKIVQIVTRINPETGEKEELELDEDYVHDPATETSERVVTNEIYECTRIMPGMYVRKRPFPFQRNSMNNYSKTKLPYNGRNFSDLHSENTGLLELGLPTQLMYIIVTYTLERTLAKSKGKIAMVDKNSIPTTNGWNEEKFLYYADALGYALVDRNQVGVDKNYNTYQVLDLSLYESISRLIELQQHFKQEWDDLIGINRQRKGQTYASDAVGNNERATFQSTVITDMIFNLYEEFTERELQGLLDLSKFTALDGIYKLWNDSEVGNEILEIEPEDYCSAEFGTFVDSASEAIVLKNKLEATVQAMLQNNVKPSTIWHILKSDNIAEMESKLKYIEELQAQAEQATASSEEEAAQAADLRAKDFEQFRANLEEQKINLEYDRKEEIEMIKGEFNTLTFQNGDVNANQVPDVLEVDKHRLERDKFTADINFKNAERVDKIKSDAENRKLKREELANKVTIAKLKPKPKPAAKKK
jgi:hypothetical protein